MRLLAERLREAGREVVETQEPGGTEIGLKIRAILLDPANHATLPYCRDAAVFRRARAELRRSDPARVGGGRSRPVATASPIRRWRIRAAAGNSGADVVMQLHDIACHGLHPDLTIYIDIDPADRILSVLDRAATEPTGIVWRIRQSSSTAGYANLSRAGAVHPNRIKIVDGHGTIEDVAAQRLESLSMPWVEPFPGERGRGRDA